MIAKRQKNQFGINAHNSNDRFVEVSKPGATLWVASVELSPEEIEGLTVGVRIPSFNGQTSENVETPPAIEKKAA